MPHYHSKVWSFSLFPLTLLVLGAGAGKSRPIFGKSRSRSEPGQNWPSSPALDIISIRFIILYYFLLQLSLYALIIFHEFEFLCQYFTCQNVLVMIVSSILPQDITPVCIMLLRILFKALSLWTLNLDIFSNISYFWEWNWCKSISKSFTWSVCYIIRMSRTSARGVTRTSTCSCPG